MTRACVRLKRGRGLASAAGGCFSSLQTAAEVQRLSRARYEPVNVTVEVSEPLGQPLLRLLALYRSVSKGRERFNP